MIKKDKLSAKRVVESNSQNREELKVDKALRPQVFKDYVGQEKIVTQLQIMLEASKLRGEPMDHILLFGPPGLGKTTLAHILAEEREVNLKISSGPILERPADLAAILTNLEVNDVLFVDEIHRLSNVVEEKLYPALEDFKFDIMLGEGPAAKSVQLDLKPFTLIGATTRAGMLTNPLRDRFGLTARLEFYKPTDLLKILERSAKLLGCAFTTDGLYEIAKRARGTPRVANRLLRRVRDYAQVKGDGIITNEITQMALTALQVDKHGLDEMDNKILIAIIDKYKGGPVGINTLATVVGEESGTIEEVYEPFLVQQGYMVRTSRGRMVTDMAYKHLNKPKNDLGQQEIF